MQAIKSKSKLEDLVTKELWKRGIRFRKNVKGLFGKPDIAIKKYKVAVFIDSCFWHVCPLHGNVPKSNEAYWGKKLERNQNRDIEVTKYYNENGWRILRIWEHEIKEDLNSVLDKIVDTIKAAREHS
ncbi:very short patch repair endonuclease [Rummeliibacillus stabekisii]|uniref:Very short patch repair endonuclease n=2 Tax=Rummeliibacillus stabekisii TaxID=241244 RepID=A0A143HIM4_9BACL|nr:very short patch repair endonuclease [Rummeliibacillus stabekisii]